MTTPMNPLDRYPLPLLADDYMPADDLEVDPDHHLEAHDLYTSDGASLSGLQVKLPRQVIRIPVGAQRVGRRVQKRKRVGKPPSPGPGPITELWQVDEAAITKDISQERKRFKENFPTASQPTSSPFLAEPRTYTGRVFAQDFTLPFSELPEDSFFHPSLAAATYATLASQRSSLGRDRFSHGLQTAHALVGEGNPGLPGGGPLRLAVHEGRVALDAAQDDTRRFEDEAVPMGDLEPGSASEKDDGEQEEDDRELEKEDRELEKDDGELQKVDRELEHDDGVLLVPKIEPGLGDEEFLLPELQDGVLARLGDATEDSGSLLTTFKRPRGRPRKHPWPVPGESLNKTGKGRSKTGCITCRKRKKKCDEAKPHCLNCEKNAVLCEGYQPLAPWKSGKEKAASESMDRARSDSYFPQSPASMYATFSYGTPEYSLPALIDGIESDTDRIFFKHYCTRLSAKLKVEGPKSSAFRQQMLPMAVQHKGLLHSILALSAANMDWEAEYAREILAAHPDLTVRDIEDRGHWHNDEAMAQINRDMNQQRELEDRGERPDPVVIKVRYGQMLCLVIKALAEGNTEGAHRMHLKAYEKLAAIYPSDNSPFMKFVHEFFKYHVCFDQLVAPPDQYPVSNDEEMWDSPKIQMTIGPANPFITDASNNDGVISDNGGGMFGLQQDIYNSFMRRIGKIRQDIRGRMERGEEPHVDYTSLYQASHLDGQIKGWADASPPPPPADIADLNQQDRWQREQAFYHIGILYKYMLWVYLYRTVYPSSTADFGYAVGDPETYVPGPNTLDYNKRIRDAVDKAIGYMEWFKGDDPCQTMLLSPAFMIGCAAFEEGQRAAIRRLVRRIKNYTTLKNVDPALRVMEEVWKRMDGRGDERWKGEAGVLRNSRGQRDGGRESSWDWQQIARDLKVDFLAT